MRDMQQNTNMCAKEKWLVYSGMLADMDYNANW